MGSIGSPPTVLSQISTDFQKQLENGYKFPEVFVPAAPGDEALPAEVSLADFFAEGKHREWFDQQLMQSGGILFRGFQLFATKDVDSILESLGWEEFPYIEGGGYATRERVHGRVLTANKYPPHKYIGFHNEAAYLQKSPTRIFFFCKRAPSAGSGGATPIVPGHVVYHRVAENHDLAGELLNKGPVYLTSILNEKVWSEKFKTNDRDVAQSKAAKELQSVVEWLDDGGMKVSTRALPELFKPDRAGRMSLFSSLGQIIEINKEDESKKFHIEFGDGKQVSGKTMEEVVRIMREEEVVFPWKEGDLLVLDNTAALHSRQPCSSSIREILVAVTY